MFSNVLSSVQLSMTLLRIGRILPAFSLSILALLSATTLWPRIYGIPRSTSLTYPEGWNAYHTATILRGGQVYGSVPGLTVANYPPLFWELVALLARQPSAIITTGRVVSLVSLALITLLVGVIAFKCSGSKATGIVASMLILTWMSTVAGGYMATNEPQVPAHALICAGLLAYITFGRSLSGLLLSSFLFCLAIFVKNNVIAVPLAVSLHLLLSSWRHFLKWVFFNAVFGFLLLATVLAHDGSHFVQCLLAPRSYSLGESLHGTRVFTDAFQIPLVVAMIWCCYNIRTYRRNLLVAILVISIGVGAAFRGGGGTNFNMFFDAIIGLALICPLAVLDLAEQWKTQPIARTLLGLSPLFLCFWSITRLGPSMLAPVLHGREMAAKGEDEYLAGVALLRSHPGPAICETIRLCFDAGKPLAYDPYYVSELLKTGRIRESEIEGDIARRRYSVIQFDDLFNLGRRRAWPALLRRGCHEGDSTVLPSGVENVVLPAPGAEDWGRGPRPTA